MVRWVVRSLLASGAARGAVATATFVVAVAIEVAKLGLRVGWGAVAVSRSAWPESAGDRVLAATDDESVAVIACGDGGDICETKTGELAERGREVGTGVEGPEVGPARVALVVVGAVEGKGAATGFVDGDAGMPERALET